MNMQKIQPGMQALAAGSPESQSTDLKAENIATLGALFPELLSERIVDGKPETAINVDVLKQLVAGLQTVHEKLTGDQALFTFWHAHWVF